MPVAAVLGTAAPPRPLALAVGGAPALGERRRLALGGPTSLVQLCLQRRLLGPQLGYLGGQAITIGAHQAQRAPQLAVPAAQILHIVGGLIPLRRLLPSPHPNDQYATGLPQRARSVGDDRALRAIRALTQYFLPCSGTFFSDAS